MSKIILEEKTITPGKVNLKEEIKKASLLLYEYILENNLRKEEVTITLENNRGIIAIELLMNINVFQVKQNKKGLK